LSASLGDVAADPADSDDLARIFPHGGVRDRDLELTPVFAVEGSFLVRQVSSGLHTFVDLLRYFFILVEYLTDVRPDGFPLGVTVYRLRARVPGGDPPFQVRGDDPVQRPADEIVEPLAALLRPGVKLGVPQVEGQVVRHGNQQVHLFFRQRVRLLGADVQEPNALPLAQNGGAEGGQQAGPHQGLNPGVGGLSRVGLIKGFFRFQDLFELAPFEAPVVFNRLRKNDSEGSEMPQSVIPRAAMNLHRSQPHSYN
jgi:hypothetical protein